MPFIKEEKHEHREDEPAYEVYGTRQTEDGDMQFLIYRYTWVWVDCVQYVPWKRPYDPYRP